MRHEFSFGGPIGLIGGPHASTPAFPRVHLRADDGGFDFETLRRAEPEDRGPHKDDPRYPAWAGAYDRRNRVMEWGGFHYSYWAMMRGPTHVGGQPPPPAVDTFFGFETHVVVPYWPVLMGSAVVPALWVRRTSLLRRRRVEGRCLACGYDCRGPADGRWTREKCPECGTVLTGDGRGASGSAVPGP